MKRLPIGISDFKKIREENRYFVDKSLFIKEIIEENGEITLLPRPRRFGKTLNLSMLKYFFEKVDDKKESKKLFSNLLIKKEEIFEKHFCQYPVIYLTFKDIKYLTFEESLNSIKRLIADEFRRHAYLLESKALNDFQKEDFKSIASIAADASLFGVSLHNLSNYLFIHHKKKPLILIDEYDTPIHTAYSHGYYEEVTAFFKSFFGAGLKDNPNIFKGVLTGILRVSRESIFSDMNNLAVYTIARDEYSQYFGFTKDEVLEFLRVYKTENRMKDIKYWYDGYIFGDTTIYNPWSILNFMSSKDKQCRPYWANTSSNQIIKSLIKTSSRKVKEEMYNLLKNIPVIKRIEENIVFEDLTKKDSVIYSFLLFCGYLKAFDRKHIDRKDYYKLLIPNLEVKQIFEDVILQWIEESYESYKLKTMLDALLAGEVEIFEELLGDFVIETLSYFDVAGKNVEKVYQAFILGLLVNLSHSYEINSEKESGFGRYDISVVPKDKSKKAVIMELKTIRKNETKEEALKAALSQIEERKYEAAVSQTGVKDICKLGVVFDGKKVWVKKGRY